MQLRRAGVADAAKLSLIGCATFIESFANDHDGDEVVRYLASDHAPEWYARELANPAKAAWLVEEAVGCPVGYAMAIPATLPGSDPATDFELKRIYMLSKWHGGGWGAKLFQAAEDEARARGAKRLLLSVYVNNLPAQKFYGARGFETIGRWIFEGFDASEDFILAKTL
jgi:GNAT superfamily N-acetyltransferase